MSKKEEIERIMVGMAHYVEDPIALRKLLEESDEEALKCFAIFLCD